VGDGESARGQREMNTRKRLRETWKKQTLEIETGSDKDRGPKA
jgi:hypothetical protein